MKVGLISQLSDQKLVGHLVTKTYFSGMNQRAVFPYILILLLGCISLYGQRFEEPLSARTDNYDIQLFLDTDKKQVKANQTVTFRNPSADTIRTMPFHMYYNAFKNNRSNFNTGYSGIPRDIPQEEKENGIWGWVEVLSVKNEQGEPLESRYIQPDDDNVNDHTVLEVVLEKPIPPFGTKTLEMEWHSQVPKAKARTGYNKDYFFMVQWYPKLGVYEPAGSRFAEVGAWNCHQYHPSTEYFGEFGVYQVEVDVPKEYVTGGSGFVLNETTEGDRKKVTYLAEDVIDFAWTAHPGFLEIKDEWKGVEIKLLVRPEHECNKERFLLSAKHTLDFFEEYIEPYPYPTLTIVSPPFYGLFSGAMEYPTLITSPTLCDLPLGIKTTETLTIHELTHQYFMQMIATNEQEEPWMDEGFTSFFEAKILDQYYPEGVVYFDYFDVQIDATEFRRGRFMATENPKASALSDWGYQTISRSTRDIVYGKAAVGLMTLEGLVGDAMMKDIIRAYFKRWKFKHPCRHDFLDVVQEVTTSQLGDSLAAPINTFLQDFMYSTEVCDYSVHSIDNFEEPEALGFFENTSDVRLPSANYQGIKKSKVVVWRNGEFIVPQEIRVTFEDGEEIIEYWDGKARIYEIFYEGKSNVVCAEMDPFQKIPFDNNHINNSQNLKQEKSGITRYFVSFLTWLENAMITASTLV